MLQYPAPMTIQPNARSVVQVQQGAMNIGPS